MTNNCFSAQAIYEILTLRSTDAGLAQVTPHDLRRTFIGNALDAGVDAITLTRITGHASVELLQRYDRRPERAKRSAQKKLDLPL